MQPFTTLSAPAAPIEQPNVDTDQIIPARFLKYPRRDGYGKFLFHDLRFDESGAERPDFVLNRPQFRNARILVTNENFGCGSSREGAVYALYDYGIACVIGPSFGDIFFNNCFKNGLLAVRLPPAEAAALRQSLGEGGTVSIDLAAQTIAGPDGTRLSFEIEPFRKKVLLKGLDEIGLTLEFGDRIQAFERRHHAERPWLAGRGRAPR
jgi:3-isopropylmalate/(R)-2-methylmalate dehydratase small subunit